MLSLYSIKNCINFDTSNVQQNQLFSIKKENIESQFVKNLLDLEKKILFKQGFQAMNISIEFSSLSNFFNKTIIDINGNKTEKQYTLCIPSKIIEADTFYLTSELKGKTNTLISNTIEDTCLGYCGCNINIRKENKDNIYAFVIFTKNPLLDTLLPDFSEDSNHENIIINPISNIHLDIIECDNCILDLTEYLYSYKTHKPFTFLKFQNIMLDTDNFDIQEMEVINTSYFQNLNINNHLIYTNIIAYSSNTLLKNDDFQDKSYFIVNKRNPGFIETYLHILVKKYIEAFLFSQNPNDNISVTIGYDKPKNAIIAIPLQNSSDETVLDEIMFFTKCENIKEDSKIYYNVNYIYACKCKFNFVYFLRDNLQLLSSQKCKFCFIEINSPSHNDSEYFFNGSKTGREIQAAVELLKIDDLCNSVNMDLFSFSDSYGDILEKIQNDEKLKSNLLTADVVRLSRNYFDVIENEEEEKLYDVINIKNEFTVETLNNIGDIDMNNDKLKSMYFQFVSRIDSNYELKQKNENEVRDYETNYIVLKPPDNCLYVIVFINTTENMNVIMNTCSAFTPIISPGSILAYTYKKELTIESVNAFKLLIYCIKII